jgi:predicted alpha/beta-fold hydrolase
VNFSVPCDLGASADLLDKSPYNFYRNRFLKKLKNKILEKAKQFPSLIDAKRIEKINSFYEFDSKYTVTLHGFENAETFYKKGSANNSIEGITVPTLLVNAKNDPMLPESCYPYSLTKNHPYVHFETPTRGGHAGFPTSTDFNWMEERALEFVIAQQS